MDHRIIQPTAANATPALARTGSHGLLDIEDKFLQERARWFRDHGGGGELEGSTRKQNEAFQRLKDRLFSLRRDRANPSGTPRASQRRASGAGSSSDPL